MAFPKLEIGVPTWLEDYIATLPSLNFPTVGERMQFTNTIAQKNIENGGGPFGAAVFETASGRLIAPGVNQVVRLNCSAAHAEIMALVIAQQAINHFNLGGRDQEQLQLVTTTEPCAQCLGAVLWSGVTGLVCGARGADAEAIGFDEGPKPQDWVKQLQSRGIDVVQDVQREAACAVLNDYARRGHVIYNGRHD